MNSIIEFLDKFQRYGTTQVSVKVLKKLNKTFMKLNKNFVKLPVENS